MRTLRKQGAIIRKRVGHADGRNRPAGWNYLIVPDCSSGHRNRYTVYRIPGSPTVSTSGGAKVIGRELPLWLAKRVCHNDGMVPDNMRGMPSPPKLLRNWFARRMRPEGK